MTAGFDERCLHSSAFILRYARVAQMMERWSYKPEVEGLSPSLGTKSKDEGGRMKDESRALADMVHSSSLILPP